MVIPGRIQNGVVVLENGASLPEGAAVSVVISNAPPIGDAPLSKAEHQALVDAIKQIATMPIEGSTDPFSGRDHDRLLYGNQ